MANSEDLGKWIIEALRHCGGKASILDICKYVWSNYESELRASGDLFYTWQYRIRWEGTKLRKAGILKVFGTSGKGVWELT
ncbi:MAG: hypothetical protein ACOX3N_02115 [Dethiobacteria bacterium]|jgi:hypothetical protein